MSPRAAAPSASPATAHTVYRFQGSGLHSPSFCPWAPFEPEMHRAGAERLGGKHDLQRCGKTRPHAHKLGLRRSAAPHHLRNLPLHLKIPQLKS